MYDTVKVIFTRRNWLGYFKRKRLNTSIFMNKSIDINIFTHFNYSMYLMEA